MVGDAIRPTIGKSRVCTTSSARILRMSGGVFSEMRMSSGLRTLGDFQFRARARLLQGGIGPMARVQKFFAGVFSLLVGVAGQISDRFFDLQLHPLGNVHTHIDAANIVGRNSQFAIFRHHLDGFLKHIHAHDRTIGKANLGQTDDVLGRRLGKTTRGESKDSAESENERTAHGWPPSEECEKAWREGGGVCPFGGRTPPAPPTAATVGPVVYYP